MSTSAVIVFAKNTQLGKVKTRLAKDIGDQKALEIYEHLQELTKDALMNSDSEKFLYYSDYIEEKDIWPEALFTKRVQKGQNLGERMHHAISEVLNDRDKLVIVGSDCPDISPELIKRAQEKLEKFDVVIGPSEDGGYYLLGLKDPFEKLFSNIHWSTSEVLDKTIGIAIQNGLTCHLLESLNDIDDIEDLRASSLSDTYQL